MLHNQADESKANGQQGFDQFVPVEDGLFAGAARVARVETSLDALDSGRHEEGGEEEAINEGAEQRKSFELIGADTVQ